MAAKTADYTPEVRTHRSVLPPFLALLVLAVGASGEAVARKDSLRQWLDGPVHYLVDAAETDTGLSIPSLRVDGGMSENPTFVQALADAAQRPVEVSPVKEATTLGAAFLAGLAVGTWASWDDIAATWAPRRTVEPGAPLDRERWGRACERAAGWIPELSSLSF